MSVRPSQSLIHYSSKTTEQNFMKLQELFTTWCHTAPPILSFYSNDFGVSQSKSRTFPYKTWGSGGIILWALLTVFLVLFDVYFGKLSDFNTLVLVLGFMQKKCWDTLCARFIIFSFIFMIICLMSLYMNFCCSKLLYIYVLSFIGRWIYDI